MRILETRRTQHNRRLKSQYRVPEALLDIVDQITLELNSLRKFPVG